MNLTMNLTMWLKFQLVNVGHEWVGKFDCCEEDCFDGSLGCSSERQLLKESYYFGCYCCGYYDCYKPEHSYDAAEYVIQPVDSFDEPLE